MITLNQRLTTVCNYLVPGNLADIGSDHAYLPYLCDSTWSNSHAIAGEVIKGPLKQRKECVR